MEEQKTAVGISNEEQPVVFTRSRYHKWMWHFYQSTVNLSVAAGMGQFATWLGASSYTAAAIVASTIALYAFIQIRTAWVFVYCADTQEFELEDGEEIY